MENTEKKIMELVKSESRKADGDLKVIHGMAPLFNVEMVYVYGSSKTREKFRHLLLKETDDIATTPCERSFFGMGVESIGISVCLVWIDSKETTFKHSLPAFMHQMVHVADGILDWAGVKDSSNEVQAHFVERETERVLREMFEMPLPQPSVQATKAIEAILKENFGRQEK